MRSARALKSVVCKIMYGMLRKNGNVTGFAVLKQQLTILNVI